MLVSATCFLRSLSWGQLIALREGGDGEVEVGVGEGFVRETEVPPLVVEGQEAVAHHSRAQDHSVVELHRIECGVHLLEIKCLGVAAAVVGMALDAEPVEGAAHVKFLAGEHIDEGQVDGRAARMSALFGDIFALKHLFLGQAGIEIGLGDGVGLIERPTQEVVHGTLGTVGVIDFKTIAVMLEVIADGTQAVGRLARHQRHGLLIPVDAGAHKVVGAEIADFENHVGDDISNIHELAAVQYFAVGTRHITGAMA